MFGVTEVLQLTGNVSMPPWRYVYPRAAFDAMSNRISTAQKTSTRVGDAGCEPRKRSVHGRCDMRQGVAVTSVAVDILLPSRSSRMKH